MRVNEPQPDPETHVPSWGRRIFDFVEARFLSIVAVVCLAAGILMWLGFSPSLGRRGRLAGLTVVVAAPYWWIFASYLAREFFGSTTFWVIDADATTPNKGALYEFPPQEFREIEVPDGQELEQWAPNLYCGTNLDLDEQFCEGTWRASASDRELIASLSTVFLVRDELEPRARRWDRLRPQLSWLVRAEAAEENARTWEALESVVLPSGGDDDRTIADRIDSSFEDEAIDDGEEDQDDAVPEELGELRDLLDNDGPQGVDRTPTEKAAEEVAGDD